MHLPSHTVQGQRQCIHLLHPCKRPRIGGRLASRSTEGWQPKAGLSYKDSGVDIDAGAELVRRIQKLNPSIGGFSGMVPFGMTPSLHTASVAPRGFWLLLHFHPGAAEKFERGLEPGSERWVGVLCKPVMPGCALLSVVHVTAKSTYIETALH